MAEQPVPRVRGAKPTDAVRTVVFANSPYAVTAQDDVLMVDATGGNVVVTKQSLYSAGGKDRAPRAYGEKVLSIQNLSMGTVVRNTSFSVFAGQITGLFGLVGSGRTETMKIVSGVLNRAPGFLSAFAR